MPKLLTASAVAKLKPAAERLEIRDTGLLGLSLVIQPSGAKSWCFRYRHGTRTRKLTLGTADVSGGSDDTPRPTPALGGHLTLAEARKLAADARHQVAQGSDPARDRRRAREAQRLDTAERDNFVEVAKHFITRYARPKNRAWGESARLLGLKPHPEQPGELVTGAEWSRLKADKARAAGKKPRRAARGVLLPCDRWHDRTIGSITRRDVRDLLDELVAADTPTQANRALAALRKLCNWAVNDRDILTTSPCQGIPAPASETSRERALGDDEIRWMWSAAVKQGYPFGDMARLLLLTGQRRDEVAAMAVAELDLEKRLWTIPAARSKNNRPNEVPLSLAALGIIEQLPRVAGAGYLFTKTGTTPISGFSRGKRGLDALMRSAAGETEIPGWTYHDLRRTAATGMAALGVAPHVTESVLNHQSGVIRGVAKIYNQHRYGPEKRIALDAWARRIDEIVTGESATVIAFPTRA